MTTSYLINGSELCDNSQKKREVPRCAGRPFDYAQGRRVRNSPSTRASRSEREGKSRSAPLGMTVLEWFAGAGRAKALP